MSPKRPARGKASTKQAGGSRASGTRTSARSTISSPGRHDAGADLADDLVAKLEATEAVAEALPFNTNKPNEYGKATFDPRPGASVPDPDPRVTASTLTESIKSDKVGTRAREGVDPANQSLDRVRVDSSGRPLTTNQGVRVADNQHSLKAGLRGPALLEDFILREKITHFDHERIPERVVHARGSGAHGYFECTAPLTDVTRASLFAARGKRTPVFVRFSTVIGERGSSDTPRDVRGFAVKFYTDEGNWDLGLALEFVKDQYRHAKPILALDEGAVVVESAGVSARLPSGKEDPGMLIARQVSVKDVLPKFIKAIAAHRHFQRWTDPALV